MPIKRFCCYALIAAIANGCSTPIDKGVGAVSEAINQLNQTNKSFVDLKNILTNISGKLDDSTYQKQVLDMISRTSQVAQLGVEGSVDFTRTRLKEDLENLKRRILHQEPSPRVPVLCQSGSPMIDLTKSGRSSLVLVGWNLDVAAQDPQKYKLIIKNDRQADRVLTNSNHRSFQGEYSMTLDISGSGIPFEKYDRKIVFAGFDPIFEVGINNPPPPLPDKIESISGNIQTATDNREGGFCILELRDGSTLLWSYQFPEYPKWGNNHSEPFAFDNLSIEIPRSARFLVKLTQEGAGECNISWDFKTEAKLRTHQGSTLTFEQTNLSLHCGDGNAATVSTPVNQIR